MKYKLRDDYVFFTKKENICNKLDKDKNVVEARIIDDKEHDVTGQLHKLVAIVDKPVEKPEAKPDDTAQLPQGNTQPELQLSQNKGKTGK